MDLAELNIVVNDHGSVQATQNLHGLRAGFSSTQASVVSFNQAMQLTQTIARGVAGAIRETLDPAIRFESAFVGVRKTVDASDAELDKLSRTIRRMAREDLPVTTVEIANVAAAAGQLGIRTSNIEKFTDVMIKLGVATNLSSDAAATGLARFVNITQLPQDQIDRLGASLVHLGNTSATTEAEILEMALRIAGAGHQVGLLDAEILGLAAGLSSVGIEAEAGGSAITRVMIEIAKSVATGNEHLAQFANIANESAESFQAHFKENAGSAIIAVIEGLGRLQESGADTFTILEDLGLDAIRVGDALRRAANAGDLFRAKLDDGNQSFRENAALNKEADAAFAATAKQLTFLSNEIVGLAEDVGLELLPSLNAAINETRKWIGANDDLLKQDLKSFLEGSISSMRFVRDELTNVYTTTRDLVDYVQGLPAPIPEVGLLGALLFGVKAPGAALAAFVALSSIKKVIDDVKKQEFADVERLRLLKENAGKLDLSENEVDFFADERMLTGFRFPDIEKQAQEFADAQLRILKGTSGVARKHGEEAGRLWANGVVEEALKYNYGEQLGEAFDQSMRGVDSSLGAFAALDRNVKLIVDSSGQLVGGMSTMKDSAGNLTPVIIETGEAFARTTVEADDFKSGLGKASDELTDFAERLREDVLTPFEKFNELLALTRDAQAAGLISQEQATRAAELYAEQLFKGSATQEKFKNEQIDIAQKAFGVAQSFREEAQAIKENAEEMRLSVRPLEALRQQIDEVRKMAARRPDIITPDVERDLTNKIVDDFRNAGDEGEKMFERLEDATRQWGRNFTETFTDAMTGGKADWKDFLTTLMRDALSMTIDETITQPIFNALRAGLKSATQESRQSVLNRAGVEESPSAEQSIVPMFARAGAESTESTFQQWYAQQSSKFELSPNPDDREHFYDWRGAFQSGAQADESGHWPSEFKREGHPRLYLPNDQGQTIDTRTGEVIVDAADRLAELPEEAGVNFSEMISGVGDGFLELVGSIGRGFGGVIQGLFAFLGGSPDLTAGGFFKSFGLNILGGLGNAAVGAASTRIGQGFSSGESLGANPDTFEPDVKVVFHSGGIARKHPMQRGGGGVSSELEEGELIIPREMTEELGNLMGRSVSRSGGSRSRSEEGASQSVAVNVPVSIVVTSLDPSGAASVIQAHMPLIESNIVNSIERGGRIARAVGRRS